MRSLQEDIDEFKRQLAKGAIRRAYQGLLAYMTDLRTHFMRAHMSYDVSGLYQGSMDITYFAIVPNSLARRSLKIAVVFDYEAFEFAAWLAARNRKIQKKYCQTFSGFRWSACRVMEPAKGVDAIVECTLADDFDFDDPGALTARIEDATLEFIDRIERHLSAHPEA